MSRPEEPHETGSIVCVQGTFFQRTGDGPGAVWQDMTWDGMFLLTWNQIAPDAPASAWRSSDERPGCCRHCADMCAARLGAVNAVHLGRHSQWGRKRARLRRGRAHRRLDRHA